MFLYPPIGLSLDNPLVILTISEQSNFSLFCILKYAVITKTQWSEDRGQ